MNAGDNVGAEQLKSLIERIERLEESKREVAEDIKEVYIEVKSAGFNAPAIRAIIKMRAEDREKRREREAMLDLYMSALGQLADTPLGKWASES
jgi:uncharacterized protein (UPF0335 family)